MNFTRKGSIYLPEHEGIRGYKYIDPRYCPPLPDVGRLPSIQPPIKTIGLVQSSNGGFQFDSGTSTTLAIDFGSNIGAGNFIGILASMWSGTNAPENDLSCSITGESTPTKISTADYPTFGSSPASAYIFWLKNATGGNKAVTLTSAVSAGNTYISAIALEFSGIDTTSPADGNITNNNHTPGVTTITTTALTPTASGDLFLAMLEETNGATLTNTSSGWTVAFTSPGSGQGGMGLYKISSGSSAETATATFTSDGIDWWAAPIAAFKAAGGGGSSPTLPQLERKTRGLNRGMYQAA